MICWNCGQEFFDEQRPRRKLCDACKQLSYTKKLAKSRARSRVKYKQLTPEERERDNAKKRERYARHTAKIREQRKLRRLEKIVARPLPKHKCTNCGQLFTPNYRGEKYCSEECYESSPLRRIYARNPNALAFLIEKLLSDYRM